MWREFKALYRSNNLFDFLINALMVFAIRALVFKSFARGKVHFSLLIFELKNEIKKLSV